MRRLLFANLVVLLGCRALPVRLDSSARDSRPPVLAAVPQQNFDDYAREQSQAVTEPNADLQLRSMDSYELYHNGGREFIRKLFRSLRDYDFNSPELFRFDAEQLQKWDGSHCETLSMDQIIRSMHPWPQLRHAFPWFGWELSTLSDPIWIINVHQDIADPKSVVLDDWHRLLLFEAGLRVYGKALKSGDRHQLVLTYKVVHEKGEPLSWLERDGWGTRLSFEFRNHDRGRRILRITRQTGRDLYENPTDETSDTRSEILMTWEDQGAKKQFYLQVLVGEKKQAFTLLVDRETETIEMHWQKDREDVVLKLYQSQSEVCLNEPDGV